MAALVHRVGMVCVLLLAVSAGTIESSTLKLGIMGDNRTGWTEFYFSFTTLGGAVPIAVDAINQNSSILPNYTIEVVYGITNCNDRLSLVTLIELEQNYDVDAIIGPQCSSECLASGLLASQWNIPIITPVCSTNDLSTFAESKYDTFMRVTGANHVGKALAVIAHHLGWDHIAIIQPSYVKEPRVYVADSMENACEEFNISVIRENLYTPNQRDTIRLALENVMYRARIIVLSIYPEDMAYFMVEAEKLNILQTNEYIFIYPSVELDRTGNPYAKWFPDDVNANFLYGTYGYVLYLDRLQHHLTERYETFADQVVERLQGEPFYSHITPAQVANYAGETYDAVILYAYVAQYMIEHGLDPRDGRLFRQVAHNIHFYGMTGSMSVDETGDRKMDFTLSILQEKTYVQFVYYQSFKEVASTTRQVVWPGGSNAPPPSTPACGFRYQLCPEKKVDKAIVAICTIVTVFCVAAVVMAITLRLRSIAFERNLLAATWKTDYRELLFSSGVQSSRISIMSSATADPVAGKRVATYQGEHVHVRKLVRKSVHWNKRSILLELKQMSEMSHDNIAVFIGASVDVDHVCLILKFYPKGSLQDVIHNDEIQLDDTFKLSIATDMINGLQYIHRSDVQYHGKLRSSTCYLDNRWNVKLSGFGLHEFCAGEDRVENYPYENMYYADLFWTAPEHLHTGNDIGGSQEGDIYGFGIILFELEERTGPFDDKELAPKEIVSMLKSGHSGQLLRPSVQANKKTAFYDLMCQCWEEEPSQRPKLQGVIKALKVLNGGKSVDIMATMVQRLEAYSSNLEELVMDRTKKLEEEKRKTDALLYQMLPRSVADQLKSGHAVKAESFDTVTIFFSDIVGFTAMSAMSTPFQVVDLLNDLYTLFDSTIERHDVYKVETIGDAYMVVSGLPMRNGKRHAGEIATMALELLSDTLTFKIRHLPDKRLLLRIGLHSGPCVAGVVGLKMPRYCLFGDTVNTASRMESNGLALRIHVSRDTKSILDQLSGYNLVERGLVEMKGKGKQMTYWVTSKTGYSRPLPPQPTGHEED